MSRKPYALAVARITAYAALLATYFYFFTGSMSAWARAMPLEAWTPVGVLSLWPEGWFPTTSAGFVQLCTWLEILFVVSALAAITGFKWAWSAWTTLILSLLVFGIRHSFGHAFRTESILLLAQFVFVVSKAADAVSFDAWWARRKGASGPHESIDYEWPLWILRLMWVGIFFSSGLTKLRVSGFEWVTDNYIHDFLLSNLVTRGPNLENQIQGGLSGWLADHRELCLVLGILTLAFEIFYPVILGLRLKWRRGFYVALAMTIIFQMSVYILMGVNFMFYFALLPIWSDRWIDSRLSSS